MNALSSKNYSKALFFLSVLVCLIGTMLTYNMMVGLDARLGPSTLNKFVFWGPLLLILGLMAIWIIRSPKRRAVSIRQQRVWLITGCGLLALCMAALPFPYLLIFASPLIILGLFFFMKGIRPHRTYGYLLGAAILFCFLAAAAGVSFMSFDLLLSGKRGISYDPEGEFIFFIGLMWVIAAVLIVLMHRFSMTKLSRSEVVFTVAVVSTSVPVTTLCVLMFSLMWPLSA